MDVSLISVSIYLLSRPLSLTLIKTFFNQKKKKAKENLKALARSQSISLLPIALNNAFMICICVWDMPYNTPFYFYTILGGKVIL